MTWVRYDDNVRNHPKVEALDDATYRLWREALEWSAQNLTDGAILARQLGLTSTRATPARARRLVQAGLWHTAGTTCPSKLCPPSGPDGWTIHDYWDYQPTRQKVREDQAAAADRKRRWMERRKNGAQDGVKNAVGNAVPDVGKNGPPIPPRPAPKGRGGTDVPPAPAARRGAAEPAGDGEHENPPTARPVVAGHRRAELAGQVRAALGGAKPRPARGPTGLPAPGPPPNGAVDNPHFDPAVAAQLGTAPPPEEAS